MTKLLLHLEGFAVFVFSLLAYSELGYSWSQFALLFLAPDLLMLGYLINKRVGSVCYNLVHTYVVALWIVAMGVYAGNSFVLGLGVIVCAHIGFDRMIGFGLKYPTDFKDTHLQRV
ncbi:MAG: DUF4260 domain-containing protein [bacterium]|nr:DUF4260 domain-containing protein [bacterium]